MRNFRCEWTNEQCFDRWFYGFPQEQQRGHKQTGCGLSESGNWASDLGPPSLWPYWGGNVTNLSFIKVTQQWVTKHRAMFCFSKQPHQQTHIDFHHTAGTWLCCIIISSLFQTVTLCHCINIQPIFFRTELFLCAELRSVKDTQKPQLYLHRQLWWQSPLLNVQRIWKYCSSPLSRVALKASISITDSGSESSHYTQFTENMQLDIFPSDSQTVGHTVQLLPLLDCSLNLYTLSDEMNLTWSICSLCKILCIMWTVVSGIISVHCSVQNTMYELALTLPV